MKFRLSKTVGEDRTIIDFMPTVVGWGSWDDPEQLIECEYVLDKNGNKTVDENGNILAKTFERIDLKYTDGNGNHHVVGISSKLPIEVNPILIEVE